MNHSLEYKTVVIWLVSKLVGYQRQVETEIIRLNNWQIAINHGPLVRIERNTYHPINFLVCKKMTDVGNGWDLPSIW